VGKDDEPGLVRRAPDVGALRPRRIHVVAVAAAAVAVLAATGLALQRQHRPAEPEARGTTTRGVTRTSAAPAHQPAGRPAVGAAAWADAVRAENARPGTRDWHVPAKRGRAPGLDAYAGQVSVRPGQPVTLYVRAAPAGPVRVQALRVGYYGDAGARRVWSGVVQAGHQPRAKTVSRAIPGSGGLSNSRMVVAPWHPTAVLRTIGWPEGHYLLRLDTATASRLVPLTVRSADARGRVLLVAGAMTWQAYNGWGGRSLYEGGGSFAGRSYAVSFDRPYDDFFGAGRFPPFDAPVVRLAERNLLALAWATDYDLAQHPELADGAAEIVIGGHAEYWTAPMWDAVHAAVARGTNLAVLGANTAYWRVRLADPVDGANRVVVGTKDPSLDPLAASDPSGATARFRDAPHPRAEEELTGMRYDCFPADAPWTVTSPHWWGYAGTGVREGEQLPGVVGPESDRVYPARDRPRPMTVVGYSRFDCGPGRPTAQTGVYWVAPSGAGVFAAGTMRWACAMGDTCAKVRDARVRRVVQQVSTTVLTAFATPRAGASRPATDTTGRYWLPARSTGTAAPADVSGRHRQGRMRAG
jgi:hypothetical protein